MRALIVACSLWFLSGGSQVLAQAPPPSTPVVLPPLPQFSTSAADLPSISQQASPSKPFSVVGPRGALLGQQDGTFEAWVFPWKVFSGMRITAEMDNYPVPIDVNEHAAEIRVQPNATTITYSHANFTIRQIMIAPKMGATDAGVMVFYQIQAVRPLTLTFSFRPVMQRMWPAESDDSPGPEWVSDGAQSGFYVLHQNFPDHAAAIAMPGAHAGILAPYQERARYWPLQFVLRFDPATDQNKLYPLLLSLAENTQAATKTELARSLSRLDSEAAALFQTNQIYYRDLLRTHTGIETPDTSLNAAFSWAISAIDQLKVKTTPGLKEEALTAGFVSSGDAARPGFGWFFGRDALWSLYAVNSYGDFETTKAEIEFLLARQRADGKVMHEWSQTANLVDWQSLPYEYASADATELLQMAVCDYLRISGDQQFIAAHWDQLQKAWQFEITHDSPDGIYDNREGSGWVESWIPSMPYQEIYLAALDQQSSTAFARLARALGHDDLATQADGRAARIGKLIEQQYYLPQLQFYAFSRNPDGSKDDTATIFPAVAWWDGTYGLTQAGPMLDRWASSEFSTDWGTRLLSDRTSFYDPISYHQGTVWPLFTGWVSVAEYRAGRPLDGYAHLMQNVDLTWAQDPGSVTELLSGEFYQVLGRSTAHQLWSSAMVISPILRGMFGLEWDAQHHALSVTPNLPADWNSAAIHRLPFGGSRLDLEMRREGQTLIVTATGPGASALHLQSHTKGAKTEGNTLRIPLPAVEVYASHALPEFGAETRQMKVLSEDYGERSLKLVVAAPAGSMQSLGMRLNSGQVRPRVTNATVSAIENGLATLRFDFPPRQTNGIDAATPYVSRTIEISW